MMFTLLLVTSNHPQSLLCPPTTTPSKSSYYFVCIRMRWGIANAPSVYYDGAKHLLTLPACQQSIKYTSAPLARSHRMTSPPFSPHKSTAQAMMPYWLYALAKPPPFQPCHHGVALRGDCFSATLCLYGYLYIFKLLNSSACYKHGRRW